ncbi:MAG: Gfo/Idh/MocA family oxidoreductase [Candidatus Brocadiia bacterium]
MTDNLRVAVIGCGKRGIRHTAAYLKDARCEVAALADTERENAERLADEHGLAANVYTKHEVLLAREQPDVVSICLWTGLHLPVLRDCAEAGVRAVFCEKPMAPTWGESLEMAEIARDAGVQLTFCHQRRFLPGNRRVRQWIQDGVFGELKRIDMYAPHNLLDCGTHSLDQAFMFNGERPAMWVMGQIDVREAPEHYGIPREHVALGYVRWENGVRGVLEVGEDAEKPTGVRILGTGGYAEVSWNGNVGPTAIYGQPGWAPPDFEKVDSMALAVRNNLDCLESGEEPELSMEKALRAAEVIFAVFESSRSRARIELPLESRDSALLTMLEKGEIGPRA